MAETTGLTGPPQPPPRTVRQEVAPKGGYAPINVARNVPKSISPGSAVWLLAGTAAMMSYGFYRLGNFNVKRRCVCGAVILAVRQLVTAFYLVYPVLLTNVKVVVCSVFMLSLAAC